MRGARVGWSAALLTFALGALGARAVPKVWAKCAFQTQERHFVLDRVEAVNAALPDAEEELWAGNALLRSHAPEEVALDAHVDGAMELRGR